MQPNKYLWRHKQTYAYYSTCKHKVIVPEDLIGNRRRLVLGLPYVASQSNKLGSCLRCLFIRQSHGHWTQRRLIIKQLTEDIGVTPVGVKTTCISKVLG